MILNQQSTSSLLASCHSAGRGWRSFWKRKDVNCLTQSWTLFVIAAACQTRCAQLCNSGMTVVGVTNHFLSCYEACSTERTHAWYYKPDQKPMAREITEPKGEAASVILLNGHVFKESPTYICLHPQTWAVLSLGQRGFFLQWAAVNREIHNWSQY